MTSRMMWVTSSPRRGEVNRKLKNRNLSFAKGTCDDFFSPGYDSNIQNAREINRLDKKANLAKFNSDFMLTFLKLTHRTP